MRGIRFSGGVGKDSYTVSVAHKEGERFVVDLIRGSKGKHDPVQTTREYASLLKEYRCDTVVGDKYAAEWTATAWRDAGINYVQSELTKSELYLECAPLFARGLISLPEHSRLLRELRLLERTAHRGGRQSVDHPRGGFDDYANSCCGVLRTLSHQTATLDWSWIGHPGGSGETDAEKNKREQDEWHRWRMMNYFRGLGIPLG
jgi:hypothetical protein